MSIRKQTKKWTTKAGVRLRICDMDDGHLDAAIALIERIAEVKKAQIIECGYSFLTTLQGEMAIDDVERGLEQVEQEGIDPNEINPLYENLILERERRDEVYAHDFGEFETKCYRCQQKAVVNGWCNACGERNR